MSEFREKPSTEQHNPQSHEHSKNKYSPKRRTTKTSSPALPRLTRSPHILPQDIPVGLIESSYVRYEAACKHAVTDQGRGAVPKLLDLVAPPFILTRKPTHQTLGERQTSETSRRLCFHLGLLFCRLQPRKWCSARVGTRWRILTYPSK